MRQLLQAAEEMQRTMNRYQPEGMLEVLAVYKQWPELLAALGKVWKTMHQAAAETYPLHPTVVALIEAVAKNQAKTSHAAEDIYRTALAMHRDDLARLQKPNNRMWDVSANPGAR